MGRLILASASPRRKELLSELGYEFECIPSKKEEAITSSNPKKVVKELALQKAQDIFEKIEGDCTVIGADTLVIIDKEIMGKPKDEKDAYRMLKKLQGKKQAVFTGVAIISRQNYIIKKKIFADKTLVYMKPIDDEWIWEYIKSGETYRDKAGAYAIQGEADEQILKIKGDYNNVVGLPIYRLEKELKKGLFY